MDPHNQQDLMEGKVMDDREQQIEQMKQQQQQQHQQQQHQQMMHGDKIGASKVPRRPDLAKPTMKLAMFKDLPAISCDVCKIAVEVMYNKVFIFILNDKYVYIYNLLLIF
jgi:ribosomal protein L44E